MPTVFISHSSITDLNAADVRKHLKQELEHRGWAVRVDIDELKGGEEWTGVLYHWLADCDAAVVLLGQTAINSKWVLREVTLLLWRMALNSPVAVVPVLLADITSADVRNSQLSELRSLQFVKQHDTASGSAQDPASLAMRIAERLPDLSGLQRESSDSMTKWVATVVDCLGDITEIGPLRSAALALSVTDDLDFATIRESRLFLAHQLLGPTLCGRLHLAVGEIAHFVYNRLPLLVDLLTPAWVDGEAARALLPYGSKKQVFAILNALRPETAEHYVKRASCCSPLFRTQAISMIAGEGQQSEFRRDFEAAIRKLLDLDPSDPLEGEEPFEKDVAFLVVDLHDADITLVVDELWGLLARFEWLNVILLVGDAPPDPTELTRLHLSGAVLEPVLRPGAEKMARRMASRLRDIQYSVAPGSAVPLERRIRIL